MKHVDALGSDYDSLSRIDAGGLKRLRFARDILMAGLAVWRELQEHPQPDRHAWQALEGTLADVARECRAVFRAAGQAARSADARLVEAVRRWQLSDWRAFSLDLHQLIERCALIEPCEMGEPREMSGPREPTRRLDGPPQRVETQRVRVTDGQADARPP